MNTLYTALFRRVDLSTSSVAPLKLCERNATFVPGVSP